MRNHRSPTPRSGFTLVELLIVIGLVTFLAGILIVAIGRAGEKAREEATRALIRKISNQVQERLEALDRQRSLRPFKDQADSFYSPSRVTSQAPRSIRLIEMLQAGLPLNDVTRPILWHKLLVKYYFPQSFAELKVVEHDLVFYPISAQYGRQYSALLSAMTNPGNHQAETESSELLYFALTQMQVLGIPTVDPGEYKASEVQDTDGDGLLEFVDAWGRPLRFYRWPTRLLTNGTYDERSVQIGGHGRPFIFRNLGSTILMPGLPSLGTPDPLAKDQDDPVHWLSSSIPIPQNLRDEFERSFHTISTYHSFMIVSSGPDGRTVSGDAAFGLFPPTDQYIDPSPTLLDGTSVSVNLGTNYGFLAAPILTTSGTVNLDAMSDDIVLRQ